GAYTYLRYEGYDRRTGETRYRRKYVPARESARVRRWIRRARAARARSRAFIGFLRRYVSADGISGAAPSPDTRRSGVTLYARSSLAIRQSRLNSREWSMSHQRRLSSPPASALPEIYAEAITTSSSAPSRAGEWDSHQRTSRISSLGSASGSQPGQYARATQGVSGRKSVKAALLMSLHLLPFRCRARSGGFAVDRADSGAARPAR